MAELVQINTITYDEDAFGTQAKTLLESVFAGEEDFSFGAEHAVPRDVFAAGTQRPDDLTGRAGVSGSGGDISIGGDFAAWDTANLVEDARKHQCVRNFSSIST